jgi:hypothetical protein
MDEALRRIENLLDWDAVGRVLWDTYSFFPELQDQALDLAERIMCKSHRAIPVWERMRLTGMLRIAGRKLQAEALTLDEEGNVAVIARLSEKVDRWQIFLVIVGIGSLKDVGQQPRLPSELLERAEELLSDTSEVDGEPARKLLAAAKGTVESNRALGGGRSGR